MKKKKHWINWVNLLNQVIPYNLGFASWKFENWIKKMMGLPKINRVNPSNQVNPSSPGYVSWKYESMKVW